jgi:hypothetical protein
MTISKEIAKKVERLNKIEAEAEKLRAELHKEFGEHFDGCYINDYFIENEPCGDEQGDGEYCNQYTGYICDSGSGTYYYPIENSKKYLAITYEF